MFAIGINNNPNYRVNPVYMDYSKKYKKACNDYITLDKNIKKSVKPTEAEFDNRHRAKIAMKKFENLCQTTPKTIKDGNKPKQQAESEAGSLHKIDYYC